MRILGNIVVLLIFGFATFAQTRQDQYTPSQQEQIDITKSVHMFPNPAVDYITVKFDAFAAQDVRVTVHNIIGNVMTVESEIVDEHEVRIRVKDLSAGYYLLAIKDHSDRFRGTYKFLKR